MALINFKPTSPGRRAKVGVVNPDLHKGAPHAALVESQGHLAKHTGPSSLEMSRYDTRGIHRNGPYDRPTDLLLPLAGHSRRPDESDVVRQNIP